MPLQHVPLISNVPCFKIPKSSCDTILQTHPAKNPLNPDNLVYFIYYCTSIETLG